MALSAGRGTSYTTALRCLVRYSFLWRGPWSLERGGAVKRRQQHVYVHVHVTCACMLYVRESWHEYVLSTCVLGLTPHSWAPAEPVSPVGFLHA
jgi:hypothetical protein